MSDVDGVALVPGRACGECTLCCKLLRIDALQKPVAVWCRHCDVNHGCTIYGKRPEDCRHFHCGYLTMRQLGEEWKPSKSKMLIAGELGGRRIAVHVDPARPDAWRREPFYSTLKQWARAAISEHKQVVVFIAGRAIVILGDREIDLGIIGADERILIGERKTIGGTMVEVRKIHKDDP